MMRFKCSGALALLLFILAMGSGLAYRVPSATAASGVPTALASLQQCITAQGKLDLVALVDQSGSLATSDPTDLRSIALREAMQQLAFLVEHRNIQVEGAIIGFASYTNVALDWTPLNKSTIDVFDQTIIKASVVRQGAAGNTNFVSALRASLNQFQLRDSEGSGCRALLWFTDGKLDISGYGGTQAIDQAGRSEICSVGGLADQLVNNSIVPIAVGLASPGGLQETDVESLKSYVQGPPGVCGSVVTAATGAYVPADHPETLFFSLQSVGDPSISPSQHPLYTCPEKATQCPTHDQLSIDRTVDSFRISAIALNSLENWHVIVTDPSGDSRAFGPTSPPQHFGGVSFSVASFDRNLQLDLTGKVDRREADGRWLFSFASTSKIGTPVRYAFSLWPNFHPMLATPKKFIRDGQVHFGEIVLIDDVSGKRLKNIRVNEISTSVSAGDGSTEGTPQSVVLTAQSNGSWRFPYSDTLQLDRIQMATSGSVLVGDTGTPMWFHGSQLVDTPLAPGYPTIVGTALSSSVLVPSTPITVTIKLKGGTSDTCLKVQNVSFTSSPTQHLKSTFGSAGACINIPAKQIVGLKFVDSVAKPENGRVVQRVTFALQVGNSPDVRVTSISIPFFVHRPVNVTTATMKSVLLTILGLIPPFGILIFFRRRSVSFENLGAIRAMAYSFEGVISGETVVNVSTSEDTFQAPPPRSTVTEISSKSSKWNFELAGYEISLRGGDGIVRRFADLFRWPRAQVRRSNLSEFALWDPRTNSVSNLSAKSKDLPVSLVGSWLISPNGVTGPVAGLTDSFTRQEEKFSWELLLFTSDSVGQQEMDKVLQELGKYIGDIYSQFIAQNKKDKSLNEENSDSVTVERDYL